MFFNLLSKLLASVLSFTLLIIIANFVLGQTLLNSEYMKTQLKETDSYARLSQALSKQVTENVGIDNAQATAAVRQVITPEVLQARVDPALTQLEAYYKGDGPPPQIEVGDLVAQLQTADVPIQPDPEVSKPIVLSANNSDKPLTKNFHGVGVISIVLAVGLIAGLMFISWKTKRYAILPNVAISVGLLAGFLALLLLFGQGIIDHFIKINFNSNTYAAIAHDLAGNIFHDMGIRYGIIAFILLLLGIGSRLVLRKFYISSVQNIAK